MCLLDFAVGESAFDHVVFLGMKGKIVQFDSEFRLTASKDRSGLRIWGLAGILTADVSPDRSRVFVGYQGKNTPLGAIDGATLTPVDIPTLGIPQPANPYRHYFPLHVVAASTHVAYLIEESFRVQSPPFDGVRIDLRKHRLDTFSELGPDYDRGLRAYRCNVSPDGRHLFVADPYRAWLIDVETGETRWEVDFSTRRDILSQYTQWESMQVTCIWKKTEDDDSAYEAVDFDLAHQTVTRRKANVPWTVVHDECDNFWDHFSRAHAFRSQRRGYGSVQALIDDRLRAAKSRMTPAVVDLFPEKPTYVYLSPEGRYAIVNDQVFELVPSGVEVDTKGLSDGASRHGVDAKEFSEISDGWVVIDLEAGRIVENELSTGLKSFGQNIVGAFFIR